MPLSRGETFAGFTIVRLLGSGGMGEVYLAEHPRLPRRDALKMLPADVSADAEFRARFNREADLAATLYHPHIVGVHDRGEYDGQLWISMDFVDGLDAGRLLASRYPAGMPTDQVVRIVTAVASALDYAHKQGLLHRDVKPANIMLTHLDDDDEQRILLADFGIARNIDDISGLTATNMTVGTVAYAAPEQLMGEEHRWPRRSVRPGRHRLSPPHRIAALPAFQSRGRHQPPPQLATSGLGRHSSRARGPRPGARGGTGQGPRRPIRAMRGLRPRTGRASSPRAPPPARHLQRLLRQAAKQPLPSRQPPNKRSSRRFTEAVAYCRDPGRNCLGERGRAGVASLAARAVSKHADIKLSASSCYVTNGPADEQRRSASAASGGLQQR